MNWNLTSTNFSLRLPDSNNDGDALYALMSQADVLAHIPRQPMTVSAQALDELRRVNMRFDTRESSCWLVEGAFDKQLIARVGIEKINWMTNNARLWWELSDQVSLEVILEVLPLIANFCFDELELHRLEMRLVANAQPHTEYLQKLGFSHEGTLPAQLEFEGQSVDLDIYSLLASDR